MRILNAQGKKRVWALYRVSTKKQTEENDIPLQRFDCENFAANMPDWVLEREFVEAGVSGFLKTAEQRDQLQEIMDAADKKEFDVLLVWMFDRLGRIYSETPFVLEYFIKKGIEVWSSKEGQQKIESHEDRLQIFIRYWQASGESIKTQMRVKAAFGMMAMQGQWHGGTPGYGYKLERLGRRNKKGFDVYDLVVDIDEAPVITFMRHLYNKEGLGTYRISGLLTDMGIAKRNGKPFSPLDVYRILTSKTTMGIITSGEIQSPIIPELQITPVADYEETMRLMAIRIEDNNKRTMPRHKKGSGLLTGGIARCGHCGARLILGGSTKQYYLKDGSPGAKVTRTRYSCYNRRKKSRQDLCDGQTGYTVTKLDEIVDTVVRRFFEHVQGSPQEELLDAKYNDKLVELKANVTRAQSTLTEHQKNLDVYKREVIKAISGASSFDSAMLNQLIQEEQAAFDKAAGNLQLCRDALENGWQYFNEIKAQHEQLLSWAEMYDTCGFESKKVIIEHLIEKVYVKRDYQLHIDWNIAYHDYFPQQEVEPEWTEPTDEPEQTTIRLA